MFMFMREYDTNILRHTRLLNVWQIETQQNLSLKSITTQTQMYTIICWIGISLKVNDHFICGDLT